MLPSDSSLSAEEYVKYFVTDENTIRHFDICFDEIDELKKEITGSENHINGLCRDIDNLNDELYALQESYDALLQKYEDSLC